jgi:hypothetical protein
MSKRNAPFVAVRTDIRKEERVLVIADIGGYNRHEAMGRLLDLWAWCADRGLEDAPADCEGYAVSEGVIVRFSARAVSRRSWVAGWTSSRSASADRTA